MQLLLDFKDLPLADNSEAPGAERGHQVQSHGPRGVHEPQVVVLPLEAAEDVAGEVRAGHHDREAGRAREGRQEGHAVLVLPDAPL